MIEEFKSELANHVALFQDAGLDGVARLQREAAPGIFGRAAKEIRRLQRNAVLHGFYQTLGSGFGSFILLEDLYPQNRLVYRSESLMVDLVFRRKGSITAFSSCKKGAVTDGLFAQPERQYVPEDGAYCQAALIWSVEHLDDDLEPQGPMPIAARLAKPGASVGDNAWVDNGMVRLLPDTWNSRPLPRRQWYNPDADDWGTDADEAAE